MCQSFSTKIYTKILKHCYDARPAQLPLRIAVSSGIRLIRAKPQKGDFPVSHHPEKSPFILLSIQKTASIQSVLKKALGHVTLPDPRYLPRPEPARC